MSRYVRLATVPALWATGNIDFAREKFGASRMMFGGDWPVANLAGDYMKVWNETNQSIAGYSQAEKDAILGGTAVSFCNLPI